MEIFFNKNIGKFFGGMKKFEKYFLFSRLFFVRIKYIKCKTYKILVNQQFMLSVKLPINSKLLVIKLLGSQKLYLGISTVWGFIVPIPHNV